MKKPKKVIGIIGVPNPMKSPLLHDLSETRKIERNIENSVDSYEFKKQINSKPRRKR